MRTLIVGGGVAGLTLAAKLRQQGREPVVIERERRYGEHGYSLGLYPFGSCVLHGLGAYDALVEVSTEMSDYEMADHSGEVVQAVDFKQLMSDFGPSWVTTHAALVDVLHRTCGDMPIRMGTTVRELHQDAGGVEVSFSDGRSERFDLVCACDGIHSQIRETIFGRQPEFKTGWVGWTWWGEGGIFPDHLVREYWLRGGFFGAYPVPGKSTFVAAVPEDAVPPHEGLPEGEVLERLRASLGEVVGRSPEIDAALGQAHDLWPWPLSDVRSEQVHDGRVVLCGDAGTAFLPTAGVGASTALRSAAALADELSRADAARVPMALDFYAKRTTKAVRGNQSDSRNLAKVMFVENRLATWGRDEIVKHMPVTSMTKQIVEAMRQPL